MQFENLLLSALIYQPEFASRTINFISPDYFSDIGQRNTFKLINHFYGKYRQPPTKDSLLIDLSNTNLPEAIYDPTAQAIVAMDNPDDKRQNEEWLFEESEKWARDKALYNAMTKALSAMQGDDKTLSKDGIPELIQTALAVRFDNNIGHNYLDDAQKQFEWYQNPAAKIPYLLECMNKVTQGGNTRKTLSVAQAGINVGKTTWLLNIAAGYAKQGLNGIYFSLEIAEEVLRERFDVCLFGETSEQIRAHDSFQYLNRVEKVSKNFGDLVIKQFPASTVHAGHLRHVCKEFEMKYKKKPDFVMVDYITLLNSATLPIGMKSDSNYYYTNVAEELRALMIEMNSIGWTAQQFNRSGQDDNDPKLSNSGLSIGVQATADFTIALVAPNELKLQGKAVCSILKNRFANKMHISKMAIGLNDDLQVFFDLPEGEEYRGVNDAVDKQISDALEQVNAKAQEKKKTFDISSINFGA